MSQSPAAAHTVDTLGMGSAIHEARIAADALGLPMLDRPKCIWPASTAGTPEERLGAMAKPTRSIAEVTGHSRTPPSLAPAQPAFTPHEGDTEGAEGDSDCPVTPPPPEPVLVFHSGTELRLFEVASGKVMNAKAFAMAYDMSQKEISKYVSQQRRYAGLTCRLDAPYAAIVNDHINTFEGFHVAPVRHQINAARVACDGLLDFLHEVIADSDDVSYAYHYNYLAWLWQNKNQAPDVVMALKSTEEGTGKSTYGLILEKLFAPAGVVLTSAKDVTGAFNAMLEGKRVVVVEETIFAGDPRNGATMRALVTGKKLRIERKYHEAHVVDNSLAIVLNTNDDWVAPVTATDRRYAVFRVSAGRVGDKAYWDNMARMLRDRRVIEDLAYELEHHALGDWHPRDHIPETGERVDQKVATMQGRLEGFLYDALDAGRFASRDRLMILGQDRSKEGNWETGPIVLTKDMLEAICVMAKEYTKRDTSRTKLARALKKYLGAVDARSPAERRYRLPVLADAKATFEKQFKGAKLEWFDSDGDGDGDTK